MANRIVRWFFVSSEAVFWQNYDSYYKEETEVNEKLGCYVECLKAVYGGVNSCQEQLGYGGVKRKHNFPSRLISSEKSGVRC